MWLVRICAGSFSLFPGGRERERRGRERSGEVVVRIRWVGTWLDRDVVVIMVLMKRARSVVREVNGFRGVEEAMVVGLGRLIVAGGGKVVFSTLFTAECFALGRREMVGAGLGGDVQVDV